MTEKEKWIRNITELNPGIFRTVSGTADEFIGIGRAIKAGFTCALVDVPNARYDALIDVGKGKILRIQIKGAKGSVGFLGGGRGGKQIDKTVQSREYKYTSQDIDILMAVDTDNGDCYIIPVDDLKNFGNSSSLTKLQKYKENWNIFLEAKNDKS